MNSPGVFFVTGAAGFIGRHVCKRLLDSGFRVTALVRTEDAELSRLGVKLFIGDLWNEGLLQEAITNANAVIHCAGDARFGNGARYHKENVELTEHIINASKLFTNNARFIYISTIGAIDRTKDDKCIRPLTEESPAAPSSDYGKSKLQAEEIVRLSGLPFTIVRPAMVVGYDMRMDSHFSSFARKSLNGSVFARLGWTGEFSVIHVDDLARGICEVATNKNALGKSYFCAGESISVADFFRLCQPKMSLIPLSLLSVISRIFIKWIPFNLKAMLLPALTASDDKLKELGWKPRYSAQSALTEIISREQRRIHPDLSSGGQTVITGAASGLGRALAIYLSEKREHLLLIDKDGPSLESLSQKLGNCSIRVVDLADAAQVDALIASPLWNSVHITELYACAGIGLRGQMEDISIDNHRKMFSINVLARIALVKSVTESMKRRHFGRVVLISSSSAFQPLPYMATYAATNSALLSLGESWAAEAAESGIHIMTVCPGGMQTNFQKSGGVKEVEGEKLMTPEAVVASIMKGLRQQKGTLLVSFRSFAMSLLARFLPRYLSVNIWRYLMEKMR